MATDCMNLKDHAGAILVWFDIKYKINNDNIEMWAWPIEYSKKYISMYFKSKVVIQDNKSIFVL